MILIPIVGLILCAYALGFITSQQRVSRLVFKPWLESLKPGDPNFWLRSRDYGAAWTGYVRSSGRLFNTFCRDDSNGEFTDAPKHPDTVVVPRFTVGSVPC